MEQMTTMTLNKIVALGSATLDLQMMNMMALSTKPSFFISFTKHSTTKH
jgi:hypothetical protein